MTAFDRFDPFEGRITAAIDEIAAARRPEYLDDVFRVTARTSQRPRWTFIGRWLPVDTLMQTGSAARLPMRPILLLALVALLVAALGIVVVGALNRVPDPYGLADNGRIAYMQDGDLWVRDTLGGDGRPLIATEDTDGWPLFSPDGRRLVVVRYDDPVTEYWVADADGSDLRPLLPDPIIGDGWMDWADDSRTLAVVNERSGRPYVFVVDTETGTVTQLDLGILNPRRVAWRPGHPGTLLVQADDADGTDLFVVETDGSGVRALDLPHTRSSYGPSFTNSGAAWLPDGETIVYNSVEPDGVTGSEHFRVRFVNADGTGDRLAAGPDDPAVQESWPIVSPDGQSILVHRWTWKANDGGEGWLAVMPADGSTPARDIGPRIPGGEDTGLVALWSPDGTTIILRSDNEQQVYEVDPVTGAWTELQWTNELPDWQRVRR